MGEREEALAKVLGAHIAEAGGWHCSCQPIDGSDGTRPLLDATWDAHAAQAVLDSPAMRDLLAEAWDEGLEEGRQRWAYNRSIVEPNPYRETINGGSDE